MTDDLDRLEQKIREAKGLPPEGEIQKPKPPNDKAYAQAGLEFVAAIGFSTFLGIKLDEWTGLTPLFLIVFFMIGTGAGFMSIFRASKNLGSAVGYSSLHKAKKNANKAQEHNKP